MVYAQGKTYLLNGTPLLVSDRALATHESALTPLRDLDEVDTAAPFLLLDSRASAGSVLHEGGEQPDGLTLAWFKQDQKKPTQYHLDFVPQVIALKSFPAPKQGAFNQALGKKTKSVLDVTGGWGGDAMLMAMQGYKVSILERNPLMATLLTDAFSRLERCVLSSELPLTVPSVNFVDSIYGVGHFSDGVDCAYLDPMFPPKRKKSAAANKQMQLLQWLIGEDLDATALANAVVSAGIPRVAVKRPSYAEPLIEMTAQQFSSKLVHYDVYLNV